MSNVVLQEPWEYSKTISGGFLRLGEGTLLGAGVAVPPAAKAMDVRTGTSIAPVKIGATASFSRVDATTRAEVNTMGPVGTDGPDGATTLRSAVFGTTATQVQVCALVGRATQEGESNGGEASADACSIYGRAVTQGPAVGRAIGAYIECNRNGEFGTGGQAVEFRVKNEKGADSPYKEPGPSALVGIWINAQGPFKSGCVLQVGHTFGQSFDVGLGFEPGSIASATYRDGTEALRSIFIKGKHEKAAIAVNSEAGPVVIGLEERNFAGTQLLEVGFGEEALDPGVVFGTGKGKSVSIMAIRNSTGQAKIFASNANNAFLTGTVQGDTGINFTAGKIFHIGAQTKTSLFRISETGVGFNGAAPVAKFAEIASPAETLAALKTAVDKLREAVKLVGITA